MIQDSNSDFWFNLHRDPDVCRIAPKMYWIHSLAGVSHLANYHKNKTVTV